MACCSQFTYLLVYYLSLGFMKAGIEPSTHTCGMPKRGWETSSGHRHNQNPTCPTCKSISWRARNLAHPWKSGRSRKPLMQEHRLVPFLSLSLGGGGAKSLMMSAFPDGETGLRWGTVKEEGWAGPACSTGKGRP